MVAIFVHKMIGISFKLLSKFFNYFFDVILCEIRASQSDCFPLKRENRHKSYKAQGFVKTHKGDHYVVDEDMWLG